MIWQVQRNSLSTFDRHRSGQFPLLNNYGSTAMQTMALFSCHEVIVRLPVQ
jgi:hypothetical protein